MPRSDLSTAAVCSPSTATMVMARTRCGSASGLSRTVKPQIGQPVDAILNCTARHLQAMGQGCHRRATIVAEKRDKPSICIVHRLLHTMPNYPDALSNPEFILSIMLAFLWQPAAPL